ncbi:hypothetical protein K4749_27580 [Streptomyces sp. TRM72054]|uniref:hypothetical protein n=1 Tax=Streptomyces sp. TRM72054 TaxID=2870562 RepID=UPI001C8B3576|nr:hypothetical protein [Streptomyces sp. TRM72054]MBX9397247.1 hypothetical protein [Streptomyces sp. TRM72054]
MSSSRVQITSEDGSVLDIERVPQPLPIPESKELGTLRRAMRDNPRINLSPEAIEAATGVFLDVPRLVLLTTHKNGVDGLGTFYAGATALYFLEGVADAASLSTVLGNPRLSHLVNAPTSPKPSGVVDDSGRQLAQLRVDFASPAEARALVEAVARETLQQHGADYSDSILSNGVMTPVEAVISEAHYGDGSPTTYTAGLYDGISRAVSSGRTRLHDPAAHAAEMVRRVATSFGDSFNASRAARRRAYIRDAEQYNAALERDGLSMPTLRQLQARRIPLRLVVGAVISEDAAPDTLPAAIATAQSARHISVNPWGDAAQDAMTARRMVGHLLARGLISEEFATLATEDGLTSDHVTGLVAEFGLDRASVCAPDGSLTPMWRALLIVHTLTRPHIFVEAKRFIRSDRGFGQVRDERYAGFLGVLIDLPWRAAKPDTTAVARRAWRNGGALTPEVFQSWTPVVGSPESVRQLADDGDHNAVTTLTVLAGTALMADAVLTRDTGSKVDDGRVPYRATPPALLSLWAATAHGRRQAQAVLETFDPTKAGGTGEGRSVQADYTYLHVDLQGQTIPDGAALQTLREGHLFEQADPDRSTKERRERRAAQVAAAGRTQSREDRNEQRRIDLLDNLGQAVSTVKNLITEAADFPNPLKEHPMGSRADWQEVRENVRALEDLLIDVRPPAEPHPGRTPDADRTQT